MLYDSLLLIVPKSMERVLVEKRAREKVEEVNLWLRKEFSWGTQQDFESLATQLDPGLTECEAENLFKRLVDEGSIARDQGGWWEWTK